MIRRALDLQPPDILCRMRDLPLQVRQRHVIVVDDADRATLKCPDDAAAEVARAIVAALPPLDEARGHAPSTAAFALRGDADVALGRA